MSTLVIVTNLNTFIIKLPNICIQFLSYTVVFKIQLTKHLLIKLAVIIIKVTAIPN